MKLMTILFMCLLPLMLCGTDDCDGQTTSPKPTTVKADPNNLQYIRDDRTNLCFAKYSYTIPCGEMCSDEEGVSIVMVPCKALENIVQSVVEKYK